jgi:very-short-patch-repair endonuclease
MAMWQLLRNRRLAAFKFRRQAPFQKYILDFVCFDNKIIVEVDGSQHFESQRDKQRTAELISAGFQVVRYWNNDVLQQPESVLEDLFSRLVSAKR